MKLKNFLKVFSRSGESSSSSTATVNYNMVPISTPVNTELIGADIGTGLKLSSSTLSAPLNEQFSEWVFSPSTFNGSPISMVYDEYVGWIPKADGINIQYPVEITNQTYLYWPEDGAYPELTATRIRGYRLGDNGSNVNKLLQPAGTYQPAGNYSTRESIVNSSSLNISIQDKDNCVYHLAQGGSITMTFPHMEFGHILTFEVIVDVSASTSINFSAFTLDGNEINIIWLDTPDFAQGAGRYFCAFRYYAPVGLMGNLYWKQDEESSSASA